jgi:hypothetical protein
MLRKTLLHFSGIILTFALFIGGTCTPPTPQPRPGNAFEGSAHWARDLAQPHITSFASDAQLYSIFGVQIYRDGRLPANAGSWGLVAWSPSQQKELQVNVRYTGTTTTTTRPQTNPPGANDQPIPSGWVNSTTIFNATSSHRDPSATLATLVSFNIATYSGPHWGMNFNAGAEPNHYVNYDGTYLGTTP